MPLRGTYEPSASAFTRDQVTRYVASGGTDGSTVDGCPVVILTTLGSRSGLLRKVAIMRVEQDGVYAVVASLAGSHRHPSWYHNLMVHPGCELQDGPVTMDMVAREAAPDERAVWWRRAVRTWPAYADYQQNTTRQIPVIILAPGVASALSTSTAAPETADQQSKT